MSEIIAWGEASNEERNVILKRAKQRADKSGNNFPG